ncbi:MAG: alpha/beta hydrolase [Chloroflexi bacterium]|nr:alpha/beta hydrolase [Chloroflexota bacterium]
MTLSTLTDHVFTSDGLRLHYIETGLSTGPVIVLLHGLRGNARNWLPVAEPLASRYRIIALDERGRGDSDWDPDDNYSRAAAVLDVERLVAELGLTRFILGGHSMGGSHAVAYAATHPDQVRALILEDPAIFAPAVSGLPGPSNRVRRELGDAPDGFDSWNAAKNYMRALRPGGTDEEMETRTANFLNRQPDGSVTWRFDLHGLRRYRQSSDRDQPEAAWRDALALRCPTLILRGELSDIVPAGVAQALVRDNPGARCVEIAAASHSVHADNLPDFMTAVEAFLAEL